MKTPVLWTNGIIDIVDDCIWFSPCMENVLCSYNIIANKVDACYAWENSNGKNVASRAVVSWRNSKYQIPSRDGFLRQVDGKGNCCEYKVSDMLDCSEKYFCTGRTEDFLYLFPVEEKRILKFDGKSLNECSNSISNVSGCANLKNDFILCTNNNHLFRFVTSNDSIEETVTLDNEVISGVIEHEDGVIYWTKSGEVFWTDGNRAYSLCKIQFKENDYIVSAGELENLLFLFPYYDSFCVYIFSFETQEIYKLQIDEEQYDPDWKYNSFGYPIAYKNNLYVDSPSHRATLVFDAKGSLIQRIYKTVDASLISNSYKHFTNNKTFVEDLYNDLDSFILSVTNHYMK